MITLQIAVFLLYASVVAVLVAVLVPGYLLWLRWGRPGPPSLPAPAPVAEPPGLDVVVPVQDEAAFVAAKLDDLAALAYPPDRVRFLVVDGASTDGTWEAVRARSARDARFVALRAGVADKTRQLNAALRTARAPWIVVTDADARLPPDALLRLMATAAADPEAAVLGTDVAPARAHALERLHWRLANLVRRQESARGAASLVAGPCYGFRRTLLAQFPADVVSDDVHVALAAAAAGKRVVVADVRVTEARSPVHLGDLFRHKLRKTDAYLREIFRFLPRAGAMAAPARVIFLWRAAQLTVLPVLLAAGALGFVAFSPPPDALPLVLPAGAALLVGASWWGLGRTASPLLLIAHGAVLGAVTLAALLAYPFSRQTAALPKLPAGTGPAA